MAKVLQLEFANGKISGVDDSGVEYIAKANENTTTSIQRDGVYQISDQDLSTYGYIDLNNFQKTNSAFTIEATITDSAAISDKAYTYFAIGKKTYAQASDVITVGKNSDGKICLGVVRDSDSVKMVPLEQIGGAFTNSKFQLNFNPVGSISDRVTLYVDNVKVANIPSTYGAENIAVNDPILYLGSSGHTNESGYDSRFDLATGLTFNQGIRFYSGKSMDPITTYFKHKKWTNPRINEAVVIAPSLSAVCNKNADEKIRVTFESDNETIPEGHLDVTLLFTTGADEQGEPIKGTLVSNSKINRTYTFEFSGLNNIFADEGYVGYKVSYLGKEYSMTQDENKCYLDGLADAFTYKIDSVDASKISIKVLSIEDGGNFRTDTSPTDYANYRLRLLGRDPSDGSIVKEQYHALDLAGPGLFTKYSLENLEQGQYYNFFATLIDPAGNESEEKVTETPSEAVLIYHYSDIAQSLIRIKDETAPGPLEIALNSQDGLGFTFSFINIVDNGVVDAENGLTLYWYTTKDVLTTDAEIIAACKANGTAVEFTAEQNAYVTDAVNAESSGLPFVADSAYYLYAALEDSQSNTTVGLHDPEGDSNKKMYFFEQNTFTISSVESDVSGFTKIADENSTLTVSFTTKYDLEDTTKVSAMVNGYTVAAPTITNESNDKKTWKYQHNLNIDADNSTYHDNISFNLIYAGLNGNQVTTDETVVLRGSGAYLDTTERGVAFTLVNENDITSANHKTLIDPEVIDKTVATADLKEYEITLANRAKQILVEQRTSDTLTFTNANGHRVNSYQNEAGETSGDNSQNYVEDVEPWKYYTHGPHVWSTGTIPADFSPENGFSMFATIVQSTGADQEASGEFVMGIRAPSSGASIEISFNKANTPHFDESQFSVMGGEIPSFNQGGPLSKIYDHELTTTTMKTGSFNAGDEIEYYYYVKDFLGGMNWFAMWNDNPEEENIEENYVKVSAGITSSALVDDPNHAFESYTKLFTEIALIDDTVKFEGLTEGETYDSSVRIKNQLDQEYTIELHNGVSTIDTKPQEVAFSAQSVTRGGYPRLQLNALTAIDHNSAYDIYVACIYNVPAVLSDATISSFFVGDRKTATRRFSGLQMNVAKDVTGDLANVANADGSFDVTNGQMIKGYDYSGEGVATDFPENVRSMAIIGMVQDRAIGENFITFSQVFRPDYKIGSVKTYNVNKPDSRYLRLNEPVKLTFTTSYRVTSDQLKLQWFGVEQSAPSFDAEVDIGDDLPDLRQLDNQTWTYNITVPATAGDGASLNELETLALNLEIPSPGESEAQGAVDMTILTDLRVDTSGPDWSFGTVTSAAEGEIAVQIKVNNEIARDEPIHVYIEASNDGTNVIDKDTNQMFVTFEDTDVNFLPSVDGSIPIDTKVFTLSSMNAGLDYFIKAELKDVNSNTIGKVTYVNPSVLSGSVYTADMSPMQLIHGTMEVFTDESSQKLVLSNVGFVDDNSDYVAYIFANRLDQPMDFATASNLHAAGEREIYKYSNTRGVVSGVERLEFSSYQADDLSERAFEKGVKYQLNLASAIIQGNDVTKRDTSSIVKQTEEGQSSLTGPDIEFAFPEDPAVVDESGTGGALTHFFDYDTETLMNNVSTSPDAYIFGKGDLKYGEGPIQGSGGIIFNKNVIDKHVMKVSASVINSHGSLTFATWTKFDASPVEYVRLFHYDESHYFDVSASGVRYNWGFDAPIEGDVVFGDLTKWNHIAFGIFGNGSFAPTMYYNGDRMNAIGASNGVSISDIVNKRDYFYIGGAVDSSDNVSMEFKGMLDNTRIYADVMAEEDAILIYDQFTTQLDIDVTESGAITFTTSDGTVLTEEEVDAMLNPDGGTGETQVDFDGDTAMTLDASGLDGTAGTLDSSTVSFSLEPTSETFEQDSATLIEYFASIGYVVTVNSDGTLAFQVVDNANPDHPLVGEAHILRAAGYLDSPLAVMTVGEDAVVTWKEDGARNVADKVTLEKVTNEPNVYKIKINSINKYWTLNESGLTDDNNSKVDALGGDASFKIKIEEQSSGVYMFSANFTSLLNGEEVTKAFGPRSDIDWVDSKSKLVHWAVGAYTPEIGNYFRIEF